MNNHQNFLNAIDQKEIIKVKFDSQEKGMIERDCVPFDFGPLRKNLSPNPNRYHLYDLNGLDESHNLSILPEQIITIEITSQSFKPADYITWQPPYNWFVARNWGAYS